MSDTPETDAKASPHIGFFSCATVPADFAKQLERERNQARALNAKFRDIAERAIAYMDPRYVYREIIRPELDRLREDAK
jgi:hypothetical protein